MTKEEVLAKYGNLPLRFSSYYKYSFTFKGAADDGTVVYASLGGSADDIYKLSVTSDSVIALNDKDYSSAHVSRNDKLLWEEYDHYL